MTEIDLNAGDHVVVKCIGDYLGFTIGNTYEAVVSKVYHDKVLSLVFDCDDDGDDRYVCEVLARDDSEDQKFLVIELNGIFVER